MKKKRILVSTVCCVALCGTLFTMKCSAGLKVVRIDGVEFSTETIEEDALAYVASSKPVFDMEELNEFVNYSVDLSAITGRSIVERVVDSLTEPSFNIGYSYTLDIDGVVDYLKEYNTTAEKPKNAYIEKGGKAFVVVDEVIGTTVDIDKLVADLAPNGDEITVSDYYQLPAVNGVDLQPKVNELNSLVNWSCGYSNGIALQSSIDYVDFNNDIININTEWIPEVISEVAKSYSTVGINRKFVTNSGETVEIDGGTWGSYIDETAELDYLISAFSIGDSLENREPIYKAQREEIGGSYIEVSLSDQYVWVYEDGEVIMETPCVTGDDNKKYNTPDGMYYISECINGKYLRGADYKTWVNKWMRLTNSGIGLHDAYWRSSFGGSIYKYNGSHGCINLPKSFAYDLYELAYTGMPVILY